MLDLKFQFLSYSIIFKELQFEFPAPMHTTSVPDAGLFALTIDGSLRGITAISWFTPYLLKFRHDGSAMSEDGKLEYPAPDDSFRDAEGRLVYSPQTLNFS